MRIIWPMGLLPLSFLCSGTMKQLPNKRRPRNMSNKSPTWEVIEISRERELKSLEKNKVLGKEAVSYSLLDNRCYSIGLAIGDSSLGMLVEGRED